MRQELDREIYEKLQANCLSNNLALKLEMLDIHRSEAGLEPLIDFDEMVREGDINLSDFELDRDFKIDTCIGYEPNKNTGYDVYTELILTTHGYKTLLKKYPYFQDCIEDCWDIFISSEFEKLEAKGGAQ